jgi:subfamily B ATP-binding cassette protein MsbA
MAQKKISRKDISNMSFRAFLRASREPYRRLFAYLRPYRMRFFLGILFGALFGVVQGLLILNVHFVAGAIFPDGKSKPPGWLVHWFPQMADLHLSPTLGTVMLICSSIPLLMALRGLCSYLNAYCMLWVSVRVLDDIRKEVFRRTLGQSMEFFNQSKAGDLVQTVFNQTRMAQQALTTIAGDVVKQPISIVTALGMLFYLDWRFTLMSFVIFPLCLLPVMLVSRKVRKAGAREEEEAGQLMVVMTEAFRGHSRSEDACARRILNRGRFNDANAKIMQFIMRWRKALEMAGPMVETVASLRCGGGTRLGVVLQSRLRHLHRIERRHGVALPAVSRR